MTVTLKFVGSEKEPEDGLLYQKLYETVNSAPTFEEDAVRSTSLTKRNLELLDILDAVSVVVPGPPWYQCSEARKLKPGTQVLTFTLAQFDALEGRFLHGHAQWLPQVQKRFLRPLVQRLEQARIDATQQPEK